MSRVQGSYRSAIGALAWEMEGDALVSLRFVEDGVAEAASGRDSDPAGVGEALAAWFGGRFDAFDRLALRPAGTPFQQSVWTRVRAIPAGRTTSYGQIARDLERPRAIRAVGAAVGANPLALVIPCHRVVAADGELTGYAAGLGRKRWLLEHERGGQVKLF